MPIDKGSRILRQSVSALILAAIATAGSASEPATTTTTNILFEQPLESGITNNIYVAHADTGGLPKGSWDLVALQKDPFTPTGILVTTPWDAGSQTGFTPTSPGTAQLGFRNVAGTSTAQMEGDTVGVYINSQDLPTKLHNQLMMISPQYQWPDGAAPVVFASSKAVLHTAFDLQVPTAAGDNTYINVDLLFVDSRGTRVSVGTKIFDNGAKKAVVGTHYNVPENVYIFNSPLVTGEFETVATESMLTTGVPWAGYRHVHFSIDQAQLTEALKYLMSVYPGKIQSSNPTDYVLGEVHLNAEFTYSPAPAELGWSMKNMKVWSTG
jgi:hypothetical protein